MVDPRGMAGANAWTAVAVVVAVVLVAGQAGLVAFATGFGPFDEGPSDPAPARTPEPADTGGGDGGRSGGSDGSGGSGGSGDAGGSGTGEGSAGTPEPPPYDLDLLSTERCGDTCRDVRVRLRNTRNRTAEGVSVHTRIYAGNTTAEGARVWEGRSDVGTLEAGASTTETARVSLSYFEAIDVKRKGGWVTVVTTVESETVTRSFEERRKVA